MEKRKIPLFKRIFLSPLSWIWSFVYFFRRVCYDYGIFKNNSFQVPIISIGNLTFGGTGKTPLTLWMANYLASKDKKVMILMRGYKGKLEKKSGIIDSSKAMAPDPIDYGDEPVIFAKRLTNSSIVVGRNRSENLKFYFPRVLPDVVLLDDGHQHLKIKRLLNVVIFDASMPFEKYEVAPLGYMREGFSALKDADVVMIGKSDVAGPARVNQLKSLLLPHLPKSAAYAEFGYRPNGLFNSAGDQILKAEDIRGRKVIAIAGIGNPQAFFKTLTNLGAELIVTESFRDHHFYNLNEIKSLLDYAKAEDALIVTTEKDMVRVRKVIEDDSILYLEIDLEFFSGEEAVKKAIDLSLENFY